MQLYTIRRRSAWTSPDELKAAAERSKQVGEQMATEIRWIRSYVVAEDDGRLGSVCVYQATSAEPIRQHAARAGFPADEITRVADTVVARSDPEPAPAYGFAPGLRERPGGGHRTVIAAVSAGAQPSVAKDDAREHRRRSALHHRARGRGVLLPIRAPVGGGGRRGEPACRSGVSGVRPDRARRRRLAGPKGANHV
jgi:hypothetical protein